MLYGFSLDRACSCFLLQYICLPDHKHRPLYTHLVHILHHRLAKHSFYFTIVIALQKHSYIQELQHKTDLFTL